MPPDLSALLTSLLAANQRLAVARAKAADSVTLVYLAEYERDQLLATLATSLPPSP